MKAFWITLTIVLMASLICWLRAGADFPIVQCLPFAGGHRPGIQDIAAFVLVLMIPWGLSRLRNRDDGR